MDADVEFFWDPVCPFAWLTSRWLVDVAEARSLTVDWRFICLRILNEHRDYDTEFPPGYTGFHTAGRSLLRVAAAVRDAEGPEAMGDVYTAMGSAIWNRTEVEGGMQGAMGGVGDEDFAAAALATTGLDPAFAAAVHDAGHDAVLRSETDEALSRTGDDVGTPIITITGGAGVSFFGPVISRVPDDLDESLRLWDAVVTLAGFGPFTELKRSMRELPDLPLVHAATGS